MNGERKSGRVVRRWTDAELTIFERHFERSRDGGRGSMKQAATDCTRALARECPEGKRTRRAVETRFKKRRRLAADVRPLRP